MSNRVRFVYFLLAMLSICILCPSILAMDKAPDIGTNAPDFTLLDSNNQTHSLHDFKGKYVVLEWVNFQCPFVKKHYESHNMQGLQKAYTKKGVVWLTICSSAKDRPGYFLPNQVNQILKDEDSAATCYLLDQEGIVGKQYAAKCTPTMAIINPAGKLIYMGAIDDRPTTDKEDIAGAHNYLEAALSEALSGKNISIASTKAYGCSVKYAEQ